MRFINSRLTAIAGVLSITLAGTAVAQPATGTPAAPGNAKHNRHRKSEVFAFRRRPRLHDEGGAK